MVSLALRSRSASVEPTPERAPEPVPLTTTWDVDRKGQGPLASVTISGGIVLANLGRPENEARLRDHLHDAANVLPIDAVRLALGCLETVALAGGGRMDVAVLTEPGGAVVSTGVGWCGAVIDGRLRHCGPGDKGGPQVLRLDGVDLGSVGLVPAHEGVEGLRRLLGLG
jgi:hypothetical protein